MRTILNNYRQALACVRGRHIVCRETITTNRQHEDGRHSHEVTERYFCEACRVELIQGEK